jgi:hypothetical protein
LHSVVSCEIALLRTVEIGTSSRSGEEAACDSSSIVSSFSDVLLLPLLLRFLMSMHKREEREERGFGHGTGHLPPSTHTHVPPRSQAERNYSCGTLCRCLLSHPGHLVTSSTNVGRCEIRQRCLNLAFSPGFHEPVLRSGKILSTTYQALRQCCSRSASHGTRDT